MKNYEEIRDISVKNLGMGITKLTEEEANKILLYNNKGDVYSIKDGKAFVIFTKTKVNNTVRIDQLIRQYELQYQKYVPGFKTGDVKVNREDNPDKAFLTYTSTGKADIPNLNVLVLVRTEEFDVISVLSGEFTTVAPIYGIFIKTIDEAAN